MTFIIKQRPPSCQQKHTKSNRQPERAFGRVGLVIWVNEESCLVQQVSVSGHVADGDNGKSHLACPCVHDLTNLVAMFGSLLECVPKLRHFSVRELELTDIHLRRQISIIMFIIIIIISPSQAASRSTPVGGAKRNTACSN